MRRLFRIGAWVVAACVTSGSAAAAAVSTPSVVLPAPSGPYGVGRLSVTVADPDRREIFTVDRTDFRRLPVTIFYPSTRQCAATAYWPDALAQVYAAELSLQPDFGRRVLAHACPAAPVASGKGPFPLILFSHGLQHTHFSYVSLLEDLASRGHIVVAIDHSYGSRATYFPDGTLVRWDNSLWRRGEDKVRYGAVSGEYYRLWADDARRILDLIERRDRRGPFAKIAGHYDPNRVAYIGHSYGGMAALYATHLDRRIRGGVNMDGVTVDRNRPDGVPRDRMLSPVGADAPLMVLNSAQYEERAAYAPDVRVVRVPGSNHMSFSDVVWLIERFGNVPVPDDPRRWGGAEGIAGTRRLLAGFLSCTFDRSCAALDADAVRFDLAKAGGGK